MFDIEKILAENGLTHDSYEELLKECEDKVGKISDLDWDEILVNYNIDWNPDTARKAQQPPLLGAAFVKQYYDEKYAKGSALNEDEYMNKLNETKRELERKKIQFRDERNAWNKQNYIDSRVEQKLDFLQEELLKLGKANFKEFEVPIINSDKEMVVTLADLHIGQTFDNIFGEYNTDIAKKRLSEYLEYVKEYGKLFNIGKVHIVCLGDEISGNIHKTIQVTNRENVIKQVKIATELISSFCYECCKLFSNVLFYSVSGNHTRIDKKDEALKDERLDDLVAWAVDLSVKVRASNFTYLNQRNLDTGIVDMNICGKTYLAVHGDCDAMTKQGIANLTMMLGFIPSGIYRGHMHYPAFNELSGVQVIQSGSLAGSGDDHTIQSRLTGNASQTICIHDKNGIILHMPVKLS